MIMTVGEWLNQKFIEWQSGTGKRQTITAFSIYLKVKYTSLVSWMNDIHPPSGENLRKLSEKLGPEIYSILDIIPPISLGSTAFFFADRKYTPQELASIDNEIEEALDAMPGLSQSQRNDQMIELYIQRGFTLLSKK